MQRGSLITTSFIVTRCIAIIIKRMSIRICRNISAPLISTHCTFFKSGFTCCHTSCCQAFIYCFPLVVFSTFNHNSITFRTHSICCTPFVIFLRIMQRGSLITTSFIVTRCIAIIIKRMSIRIYRNFFSAFLIRTIFTFLSCSFSGCYTSCRLSRHDFIQIMVSKTFYYNLMTYRTQNIYGAIFVIFLIFMLNFSCVTTTIIANGIASIIKRVSIRIYRNFFSASPCSAFCAFFNSSCSVFYTGWGFCRNYNYIITVGDCRVFFFPCICYITIGSATF